ncbi:MAG: Glu/Leu/Phe/Val dehydrogenase [Syntrophobacterales bacterium]|jgi:glutamate dehydrogenase (NAD(P)+)|nr:Glu/Leu/Phe/Val dehydrogenase [Syntrophobacterales bacterium]
MLDAFNFADDLGPAKIIHVHEPAINLKAVLVVDNVAAGPALGGVRMAPDVTTEECCRLARAMTLKNAAAGLPHGGGKVVVLGDPNLPKPDKERLIRALACSLRNEQDYIFAPDMGTDEECMAWINDEIGRVVGLPAAIGGIPLDEIGATGWGLCQATEVAMPFINFKLEKARLVIQGFGAVGRHAARFLTAKQAILVGVSDSRGAVYCEDGLDVDELCKLKEAGEGVTSYPKGEKLDRDAIIDCDCDIWIPAARPDVVNENNVHRLKARLVVQGANIPLTYGAEQYLNNHGVLCVPDFIANAGGVICAAMEYQGARQGEVFEAIAEKVRYNTRLVLEEAQAKNIFPREAALDLALQRVKKAMAYKRWSIY